MTVRGTFLWSTSVSLSAPAGQGASCFASAWILLIPCAPLAGDRFVVVVARKTRTPQAPPKLLQQLEQGRPLVSKTGPPKPLQQLERGGPLVSKTGLNRVVGISCRAWLGRLSFRRHRYMVVDLLCVLLLKTGTLVRQCGSSAFFACHPTKEGQVQCRSRPRC